MKHRFGNPKRTVMNKRNNLEKYVRRQPPNTVITTFGAGLLVSLIFFLMQSFPRIRNGV
jgi:hypothetical protein